MARVKARVKNKTNRSQLGVPARKTADVKVLGEQLHRMVQRGAVEVIGEPKPVDPADEASKVEVLEDSQAASEEKKVAEEEKKAAEEKAAADKKAEEETAAKKAEEEAASRGGGRR